MHRSVLAMFQPAPACACGHRLVPGCDPSVRTCPDCNGPCPACGHVHTAELLALVCAAKSPTITAKDAIAAAIMDDEDGALSEDEVDAVLDLVDRDMPEPNPKPAEPVEVEESDFPEIDALLGDITFPGA